MSKGFSWILSALLILSLTEIYGQGPGGAPPKPVVTVGEVFEAENIQSRRYTGHIVSPSVVYLVPRVNGELLEVGFHEGDYVEKGQILYQIRPVRYDAALKNARAKVAEAKARFIYAENNYRRISNLHEKKVASRDAYENALSELETYRAGLLAAEANLITAQDDLFYTKITAPIAGKIGVTNFTVGNYVTTASGTLATIMQVDPIRVSFAMSNRDFLSLFGSEAKLRAQADISIRLADDSWFEEKGRIDFIDNEVNRRTDTIRIYVIFDNPDRGLIPGSTVTVMLTKQVEGKFSAIVPSALMYDGVGTYVYVVNDKNVIEKREVVAGNNDGRIQILKSGSKPGERIVIDGMHKAMPGMEIIPDFRKRKIE